MSTFECCCGGHTLAPCTCPSIPDHLVQTSSDHVANNALYQDATYDWGPFPAWLPPLIGGTTSGYLSNETFWDAGFFSWFRYWFACHTGGVYSIVRAYEVYNPGGGVPALGAPPLYTWPEGVPGNVCSPFALTVGSVPMGYTPLTVLMS